MKRGETSLHTLYLKKNLQ